MQTRLDNLLEKAAAGDAAALAAEVAKLPEDERKTLQTGVDAALRSWRGGDEAETETEEAAPVTAENQPALLRAQFDAAARAAGGS